jgi:hypothetical protein
VGEKQAKMVRKYSNFKDHLLVDYVRVYQKEQEEKQ